MVLRAPFRSDYRETPKFGYLGFWGTVEVEYEKQYKMSLESV